MPGLSFPILALVASAILFAPLSSWLALQRARSWALWFAFGVVLGPFAVLLLALAPPGRCPACGTRTVGWPRSCVQCGLGFADPPPGHVVGSDGRAPTTEAASVQAPGVNVQSRPADAAAGSSTMNSGSGRRSRQTRAEPVPMMADTRSSVASFAAADSMPILAARSDGHSADLSHLPATALGRRATAVAPAPPKPPARRPSAGTLAILGSAVFVGGSEGLQIGSRYLLARVGSELHVLGPIHISPAAIATRVGLGSVEPTIVSDRLLLSPTRRGRGADLAFSSVLLEPGVDLSRDLRVARRTKAATA